MKKIVAALIAATLVAAAVAGMRWSSAQGAVATTPIQHVVLILEENHNAPTAKSGMPFMRSQGAAFAQTGTANYSAITHPSLPNYLALTEGNTGDPKSFAGTDCGTSTTGCMQVDDNIYHQADVAGLGWNQWSESMPSNCAKANKTPYVVHHAPAPFYTDLVNTDCSTQDVPFNKLSVPNPTAGFTFVTPNLNDDAHNGSLTAADSWLKTVVNALKTKTNYTNGSTLIEVTFDEGSSGNNHVYTVFINPALSKKTITTVSNHYSLLRLNEELLGLPLLAGAKNAPDIRPALGL